MKQTVSFVLKSIFVLATPKLHNFATEINRKFATEINRVCIYASVS